MSERLFVTNIEKFFGEDNIIVSKTDKKGRIRYANRTFLEISGYTEADALGQPHSIIRHPDMPRTIFKLMWDHLERGQEIFAYVKNRCRNGDHYWVLAHVTPSFDATAAIVGYHSNRRVPDRKILEAQIMPLYAELLRIEGQPANRKQGLADGERHLTQLLDQSGVAYGEFIARLGQATSATPLTA